MDYSNRKIHYILLQEDYYTSRNVRRMIENLQPDYIFSEKSEISFSNQDGQPFPDIDLVIADIQLSEGVFFKLLPPELCRKPVIIFAENETYLKEMEKYILVDYLLKPVSQESLEKSLNKFEEYYQLNS